ncbi:MAG: thiamine-phosphate kinase [Acidobacteriota bacterium]|nr:thiamine-phosphate kinase [Acidobacteriota bacterium]
MGKRFGSGEEGVLERIRQAFEPAGRRSAGVRTLHRSKFVSLGMGDDAALVKAGRGREIVLTCDWFLEETHFLRDKHPADSVGWKCLARAVSDVAAMGGVPRCFLLSLALPEELAGPWLDGFLGGLKRAAGRFGCVLAGGDSTERRDVLINVTVVGEVASGRALLRSGARAGDIIFVSGQLGEAESGLRLLRGAKLVSLRDKRLRKHLYPEPRLALGRWLSEERVASAAIDLSDGLSSDLRRLCMASGVGVVVDVGKLPAVRADEADGVELALHGGDDYELLFTVAKKNARRVPRSIGGTTLTAIGEMTRGREVMVVDEDGKKKILKASGWDPFRRLR